MVQNIINSINNWRDWYNFTDKVMNSNTYKHSWFVVSQCFDELPDGAKCPNEVCLGKGLTEGEANRICEANRYAVENCGTDYAEIWVENLFDPCGSAAPYVYERATGEHVTKAFDLQAISDGVTKKFEAMGLYD